MAARKPPSKALQALCDRVNELGRREHGNAWHEVRPRQVERWAEWELLPAVERPGRGRGRGREPEYRDEHVRAIIEVASLVRRYRSIPVAAAILFMRGRPIPIESLRMSYTAMLDRIEENVERLAEQQREQLDLPARAHTDLAEMAESGTAHQLTSSPETRELRARFRDSGLGVQNTLEIISGVLLQILTSGKVNDDDLGELQQRLNLPIIPEPPPEKRWLPTDDQIRANASLAVMKQIMATATIEDFDQARAHAITMNQLINSPQGTAALAAYGLSDVLDMVRSGEEATQTTSLLVPLIFRVMFGINVVALAELLISNTPDVPNFWDNQE